MSEQDEQEVRVVDKRGQGSRKSAEVPGVADLSEQELAEVREKMAAQGKQAEKEAATDNVTHVVSFVVMWMDHMGAMHLVHRQSDLQELLAAIAVDREATPTDVINMSAQLQLSVQGKEAAGQVMQAMAVQSQQAFMARNGAVAVDPRIQQVAGGRR